MIAENSQNKESTVKALDLNLSKYTQNQIEIIDHVNSLLFKNIPISNEEINENEIEYVSESFEKGFETTMKYISKNDRLLIVSIETKRN